MASPLKIPVSLVENIGLKMVIGLHYILAHILTCIFTL